MDVARRQLCPELISKPRQIMWFHINTEENVTSTEMKGGGNLHVCVSRMEEKREKRLKKESWKSQLGEAMSFPAHQPIRAVRVVTIYSPSAPAAALPVAYCQEVGQKPIFVSVLLWPQRGPYLHAEMGKPLNGGWETRPVLQNPGLSGVTCPGGPSTVSGKREKRCLQQQGLPLGLPISLCLPERDFKGIRDFVCG